MNFICGAFEIHSCGQYRDYTDLEQFVRKSGVDGHLLGEDASDFMTFYALEVKQPFQGRSFRLGIILDNTRGAPCIAPMHGINSLAIGMNRSLLIFDLGRQTVVARFDLDSVFHRILCNSSVLVAIHELGAVVVRCRGLKEIATPYCEVVADAELTNDRLTLVSMDEETTVVELAATSQECN
ncbi:MAG: hypothetical protein FJ247_12275 [Nitrospira sp.]|nr:hypothetical protein [Nitrospira sp.]